AARPAADRGRGDDPRDGRRLRRLAGRRQPPSPAAPLPPPDAPMSRRAWSAFAAVSVLWGIPYLFIKIADDHGMPPLVLAWGRVLLGAAVLLVIAGRAGALASLRGRWRWLLAFAVLGIVIPFPVIAVGTHQA